MNTRSSGPRRSIHALALASLLTTMAGCADDPPTSPATADPSGAEPRMAAASCGALRPGERLYRGEGVWSCNGMAHLKHQTDGNVVLFDRMGWVWQTGTAGKSTVYLEMQHDGNLVLYSPEGVPHWNSQTHGKAGASLAVQDDCHGVIYHNGVPVWRTATQCRKPTVDPLAYMQNTSGWVLQDPETLGVQASRIDGATSNLWIQKSQSDAAMWEQYGYDATRVFLKRDTSAPPGSPGTAYDVGPVDAMYFPRPWTMGGTLGFTADVRYFDKQSCAPAGTVRWLNGVHKLRYAGWYDMGGDIGNISVAVVDRYHDTLVNKYNPHVAERFWYGQGYGWVRWEHWDDFAADPNWDRSDPVSLRNTRPGTRATWNRKLRTGGLPFTAVNC